MHRIAIKAADSAQNTKHQPTNQGAQPCLTGVKRSDFFSLRTPSTAAREQTAAPSGESRKPDGHTTHTTRMKIEDIEITELQRVSLRPGDLLAVKVDQRLSKEAADRLREYIEQQVPGHDILILDSCMSLAIVGQD